MRAVYVTLLPGIYLIFSFVLPLGIGFFQELLLCALLLIISSKFFFYKHFGGSHFSPILPENILKVVEAIYASLYISFLFFIFRDLIQLLYTLINFVTGFQFYIPFSTNKQGFIIIAISIVLAIRGGIKARQVPEVFTKELFIEDLPEQLEGFTIIQLSDLHVGSMQGAQWLEEIVKKVNAEEVDAVVLTGDINDGSPAFAPQMLALQSLKSKFGTYGVVGNHEYVINCFAWVEIYKSLGVDMLSDEHRVLEIEGENIILGGMDDIAAPRFGYKKPSVEKTFENAPEGLRILLAHNPSHAKKNSKFADIQLSGHTHGGMLNFMKPGFLLMPGGYVMGLYQVNNMQLFISAGAGQWTASTCRIGVPNEINKLILRKA